MNISLCKHKSGQMLQAVKQFLTWMLESFDARFPVSVNSLQWAVCPHLSSVLTNFAAKHYVWTHFEPIFSLRVHGWIQTTVSQLAGVSECRRTRQLLFFAIGCWLFIYWCMEDLNKQFSPSRNRFLQRTPTSQDRFALRQLLWPDFSTYKYFDSSTKVITSLHVKSLAVRDRQWNDSPAKFKITWRHSNRPIRWRP